MKIFNNLNISKKYKRSSLAIGNFDGVHKGHQKIFKYVKKFYHLGPKRDEDLIKDFKKNQTTLDKCDFIL